jgi:hypothetical protein
MAKRVQRRSKRRAVYVHIGKRERAEIRAASKYVPSLEKYVGEERLTPAQYGAFQKAKNKLRHKEQLRTVTAAEAKKLHPEQLEGGGIRALRLRNIEPTAKLHIHKDGVVYESNGRDFELHPVIPSTPARLEAKARELLERKTKPALAVYLYNSRGRMDRGFGTATGFRKYADKFFNQYQESEHDAREFIIGVVALTREPKNYAKIMAKKAAAEHAEKQAAKQTKKRKTKRQQKRGRK